MAYIDGFTTRYECPLCGVKCRPNLIANKGKPTSFSFIYEHIDNIVFVNGYPSACENNGKSLSKENVNKINSLNIITGPKGTY